MAIAAKISTQPTTEQSKFSRPSFNESKQAWTQLIGYRMNKDTKQRTRRPFSFGKVETWAIAESVKQQSEFMSVEALWSETGPMLQRLLPEYDWSKPVWLEGWIETALRDKDKKLDEEQSRKEKILADLTNQCDAEKQVVADDLVERSTNFDAAAIQRYLASQGLIAVATDSVAGKKAAPRLAISVYEAVQKYAKSQADRVGASVKPIKLKSAKNKSKELVLALGLSSSIVNNPFDGTLAPEPVIRDGFGFDVSRSIYDLEDADTAMEIVSNWLSKKRTGKNRIAAFKAFLSWCGTRKNISGFVAPKLGEEAKVRTKKKSKAVRYDAAMVKAMVHGHTDAHELFSMICLNSGMYQMDISNMTDATIITHRGKKCFWWKRSKEDLADKNDGNDFFILTPIWPETWALIEKMRGKKNSHGRLFLSRGGTPLCGDNSDAVGKTLNAAWDKYVATLPEVPVKKLTVKQWRKLVWNIIKRKFGANTAQLFAGQKVNGIGFNYDDASPDDYNFMFKVMRKVRRKLILDGVFADSEGKIQPRSA